MFSMCRDGVALHPLKIPGAPGFLPSRATGGVATILLPRFLGRKGSACSPSSFQGNCGLTVLEE